jgi:sigma-B regulation protein RsbU (phosphoserine phosphatase)
MPYVVFDPIGLATHSPEAEPRQHTIAPVLSGTYGHGVVSGTTVEEIYNALANGAKRMLFGKYSNELAGMMPPPQNNDVLMIVAECRLLHGADMPARLAQAIHHRAHLTPDAKPKLQLVLFELITNAIEHGNLGLTEARKDESNEEDWFEGYRKKLQDTLKSPLGRIPVMIACRHNGADLEISIEDRGMGFSIRNLQNTLMTPGKPLGHGLGLVFSLLNNRVDFANGGRKVTFKLPIRPQNEASVVPTRSELREQARLLLVDDQALNLEIAERIFRTAGFGHIATCNSSIRAVDVALDFKPDIMFLDIMMPGIDGYALCQKMKADSRLSDIPVVFFSGADKAENRTKGFQVGAVDYVTKPVESEELVARTETHLMNFLMLRKLKQFSSRMETDLERARLFQHDLLPSSATVSAIAQRHNLEISTIYQGCDSLAGDYWTILELDASHVAVCLVDFTGHGVIAALNTVQLHTLLSSQTERHNPVAIALNLNHHLHKLLGNGSFASFIYGVLDTATGDFSYAGGGIPPVMIRQNDGSIVRLDCKGLPLGLAPDIEVLPRRTKLMGGDTLLAVSDALTDTLHTDGSRWGGDGLERAVSRIAAGSNTETVVSQLLETFYDTAQLPVDDDLTIVALTYKARRPLAVK